MTFYRLIALLMEGLSLVTITWRYKKPNRVNQRVCLVKIDQYISLLELQQVRLYYNSFPPECCVPLNLVLLINPRLI